MNACACHGGAALISADDINSSAPLRQTDGSTTGLGGPFFQHAHSHKALPTFTLPLGSVGKTEAGSSLCPVSWSKDEKEDEEERFEGEEGRIQPARAADASDRVRRCFCILPRACEASQTLKCNISHRR